MQKLREVTAFFALLRAGLWEEKASLSPSRIDLSAVYQLAESQSVVGLIAAGIENLDGFYFSKVNVLPFTTSVYLTEKRNIAMNAFIELLMKKFYSYEVCPLLVKGQGIAQCYERPLWRSSGDVDLLVNSVIYENAKAILSSLSNSIGEDSPKTKHFSVRMNSWCVELHGTLRGQLGRRIDKVIDEVQSHTFELNQKRTWQNGDTLVYLPCPDNDVYFVFTHILQHFFRGGIGLRQLCDLCRLLWTYKDSIDKEMLLSRLKEAHIMTEWKVFAALFVNWLGMPIEAVPLYDASSYWRRKASRVISYILEMGNFGQNRDNSYQKTTNVIARKFISFFRSTNDSLRILFIFPFDSISIWFVKFGIGLRENWGSETTL